MPIEGYLVDRFGPRPVVLVGGLLCGIAWVMNAYADTLTLLYVAAAIGGIGAGAVYGTCVGNALKWFPDRRGLAAGLTAAGFGAGSALTDHSDPGDHQVAVATKRRSCISGLRRASSYSCSRWASPIRARPPAVLAKRPRSRVRARSCKRTRHYRPLEMIREPVFWVMYVMFVLVGAGGLMATAQLALIAKDFKIADVPVSLIGITLPALTFALAIDRVLNGITRPFFGWVSDHIGARTRCSSRSALEAVGILALWQLGHDPVLFVS